MKKEINSNGLKILAMFLMLIDHIGAVIFTENQILRSIGRLSFPIFAFLIVEGFFHTKDLSKYIKRLFIFGIIAEIPYDLAFYNTAFYPYGQNIMFTLLLGLLCIHEFEKTRDNTDIKLELLTTLKIVSYCVLSIIGFVDYGISGVFTIIVFYVFRTGKFYKIGQLIALTILHAIYTSSAVININILSLPISFHIQALAILALPLIWLYNGKKGTKNKVLQYIFYAFYPVHLIVLCLIRLGI